MINNTIERLRTMKMNSFASELERQMEDKDSYNQLGFEERLTLLVDSEWNRRQDNKLTRFIRNARFSAPSATIEGIEYIEDRHLDKAKMLRFATCQYINDYFALRKALYRTLESTISLHGKHQRAARKALPISCS